MQNTIEAPKISANFLKKFKKRFPNLDLKDQLFLESRVYDKRDK